jgi:hypothetical protein
MVASSGELCTPHRAAGFENQTVKIILKDSRTGLYYGGDQKWSADSLGAMEFSSSEAAAALALKEKLETANVVMRYEDPACELTLPLAACVSDAARATVTGNYGDQRRPPPRQP